MKVLSIPQTQAADQYTIEHEPISSIDLMERAAQAVFYWISAKFKSDRPIYIFCGKGNNGGDGLGIARLLFEAGYNTQVGYWSEEGSADYIYNWQRLPKEIKRVNLSEDWDWQQDLNQGLIIDALFGSGLNRPLEGKYRQLIEVLNASKALKVAIDIPSGLFGDRIMELAPDQVFKADYTLSFQYPKYSLLHPFTAHLAGQTEVLDIGLDASFIENAESAIYYASAAEIKGILRPRNKHTYKGHYGKAWFLAGSPETMGAALIAAESALRCGLGLLKVNVPEQSFNAFNSSLPEAMLEARDLGRNKPWEEYQSVLAGPGLGKSEAAKEILEQLIKKFKGPLVLDADALNLLAQNPQWYSELGEHTLLSPHPGEFKRLLGINTLKADQLELAQEFSQRHQIFLLLKGAISVLISPEGKMHFYDLGHPALAKGGSGDLLAGAIAAFLAQGYSILDSVSLAQYAQGNAAKLAALKLGHPQAVLSSDIVKQLGAAFAEDN